MTKSNFFPLASLTRGERSNSYNLENLPTLNVHLLGRKITLMTASSLVSAIHRACIEGQKITVANYNVHAFNLSMQLPWFYYFLQSAEIVHCDGFGILKGLQFMGLDVPLQYRVSYSILMPQLLEHCNRHGLSIFLLGSKAENLEAAIAHLQTEYPNIQWSGHHGYFDREDPAQNQAVIQQINQVKPNILIVGMGMPVQENWLRLHGPDLNVNVMMAGGAIIDRLAGQVSDCPAFLSNRGLEWLYRLSREPKRLASRYLLGNPAFLLHIALAKADASFMKGQEIPLLSEAKENFDPLFAKASAQDQSPVTTPNRIKRLGDYLIEAGLLTQARLEAALSEQKATGMPLGELLARKGWIRQQTIEYLMQNVILRDRSTSRQPFLTKGSI